MHIILDFSPLVKFIQLDPEIMLWVFFKNFAWPFFGLIFVIGVRDLYLSWLRGKWSMTHKFSLLAIDIPRGNEQSPKAVENMFTYLGGAHGSISFFEKWFEGLYQKSFSFEIISIGGSTQFLVRTPVESRNLVESAVYSQYPDAEIFEVEDYVDNVPHEVPNEEYDFWGSEFVQGAPEVYPIKCYHEFEDPTGPKETQFKDPMASFMDLCSSMTKDEQFWFQLIVMPIDFKWVKKSEKEIDKLLGRKPKPHQSLFSKFLIGLGEASESIYPIWGEVGPDKKKEDKPKTLLDLTPGEQAKVEAIQNKASKLGFDVKIRVIYMAKKEAMNRAKAVSGFVGYIKQFLSLNLNNLKPELKRTATKTAYFYKKSRLIRKKRIILDAYINRSDWVGATAGVFNIEELATLWHFPLEAVSKSAMLQRVPGKKANAPSMLPLDTDFPASSGEFLNFFSDEEKPDEKYLKEDFKEDILEDSRNEEKEVEENIFDVDNNVDNNKQQVFRGDDRLPPNLPVV